MPLQIRRGPTADRESITPLDGELVYDTTTGAVFVGNGLTPGGIPVTNISIADVRNATAEQFLGPAFADNTLHSGITFQYVDNRLIATVSNELSGNFSGNFFAEDSALIIDGATGTVYGPFIGSVFSENSSLLVNAGNSSINLDGTVKGNIIPDESESYDIGSPASKFKDLYLSGSSLWLGDAQLTASGTSLVLPTGSTIDGNPLGIDLGQEYEINIKGDVRGSVFPDDSSMPTNPEDPDDSTRTQPLVDAINSSINLNGTVKGNIVPDVPETHNIGSLTRKFNKLYLTESEDSLYIGNAAIGSTGTFIDLPAGSTVGGIAIGSGSGDGVIEGQTYSININGDLKGSVFGEDSSVIVDATSNSVRTELLTTNFITSDSLRVTASDGSINLISSTGSVIFGNGPQDINGNIYLNRLGYAGNNLAGFTINTSQGFTPDIDGFNFIRTRGPSSVPTSIDPFDVIGKIGFIGFDGSIYRQTMVIETTSDVINSNTITSNFTLASLDSSGTMVPRMRLLADGRLMLGPALITDTSTDSAGIEIFNTTYVENANSPGQPLVIRQFFDSVDSNNFNITRSRGTRLVPTAVLTGDKIFEITCLANDGSDTPALSSRITFNTTGTISTAVVPGLISLDTANTSGVTAPRLRILQDGRVFIGPAFNNDVDTTTSGGLEIFNTQYTSGANAAGQPLIIRQFFDDSDSNKFTAVKNRGTRAVPTGVIKDDKLFEIAVLGNDGSVSRLSSRISFITSETVSSNIVPGMIALDTADVTGTIRRRVEIRHDGILRANFGVNASRFIQYPVYPTPTERDTTLPTPSAGMVVFVTDSTGSGGSPKLQVNTNGTTGGWVDLH
jgi:hypothetical protein